MEMGPSLMLDDMMLANALAELAHREPLLGEALARVGMPSARLRPRGYETLLRTILGQQVSVAAATAMWARLEAELGAGCPPDALIARDHDRLRACGLSRQKQGYARSLAEQVLTGALNLNALPADDEEAITRLTQVKGIGRWSAEIYLLFAEGRPDIWPAGDLAVQIELGRMLRLPQRPTEVQARLLADGWRPWRGAVAIFAWHHYKTPVL